MKLLKDLQEQKLIEGRASGKCICFVSRVRRTDLGQASRSCITLRKYVAAHVKMLHSNPARIPLHVCDTDHSRTPVTLSLLKNLLSTIPAFAPSTPRRRNCNPSPRRCEPPSLRSAAPSAPRICCQASLRLSVRRLTWRRGWIVLGLDMPGK